MVNWIGGPCNYYIKGIIGNYYIANYLIIDCFYLFYEVTFAYQYYLIYMINMRPVLVIC